MGMLQSARLSEISIILAIQPLDRSQYAVFKAFEILFDNSGMIYDAANGLDWSRAAEQFSHTVAVAKYLMFCTTCEVVQAPVKFKLCERLVQLFKIKE